MSKRLFFFLVIIIILLALLIVWLVGSILGEKFKVNRFISKAVKSVTSRNIIGVMDILSKNYHDQYGNNRDAIVGMAHQFFNSYDKISVKILEKNIVINDPNTETMVDITAQVSGVSQSGQEESVLQGEEGRIKIKLKKEDKKWKLIEIEFLNDDMLNSV